MVSHVIVQCMTLFWELQSNPLQGLCLPSSLSQRGTVWLVPRAGQPGGGEGALLLLSQFSLGLGASCALGVSVSAWRSHKEDAVFPCPRASPALVQALEQVSSLHFAREEGLLPGTFCSGNAHLGYDGVAPLLVAEASFSEGRGD